MASNRAAGTRRRLGPRTRKAFLALHIASAGAWIGMDIVMGVLVFTSMTTDGADRALRLQALELFAIWPLFATGVVCLATGIVLGLGSKYGLFRYWWVAVKLVLNIVLCTLVLVLLRPGVREVAEQARQYSAGEVASLVAGDMIFPPVVSTTALLVAVVLSVFKPWGRIRKQTADRGPARAVAGRVPAREAGRLG